MDIKTQKMLADVVLNAQNKTVKPYTTTATVKSVNNGIVYVEIPGSDRDTPVKNSSVSVKKGDVVDLVVSHDDTHITGNRSDVAVPESTAQKMSQTLEATRLEMDNELNLFNNKIKMVNNSIEMQDNKIEMQNNTITQFGNTIDQQNNIIEQQNNNITEIGNTVNYQGNTITEIGNTIELQNSTIETLDSTVQTQGSTIQTLKSTVETQGSSIETLDSTVQTLDSTVQTLDSTVQTQGSTIQTLDSNVKIINSAFVIRDGKLTGISEIITNILDSGYVTTDLLNADVAWIENGKIKEGAIGETEIAKASITTAKVKDLSADVITSGTIRTERLILTTDEVDPKTGEKKVALITALNAKVNSGEGNILDGAVIADDTITAAKIDVVDLNAFKATIGNFTIGTSSMYNGKTSLKDPTNGVYIGTDGIALGQGSLLGMTDDSPFRVESDGDFHLGAKENNYINFNAFTGELDINAKSIKMGSKSVASTEDVTTAIEGIEVGGRNYIKYGKGDTKDGFFKNFSTVENGYGEYTLTSKNTYTSVNLVPGYVLGCRDYEVGRTVTFSYDIMYTNWDFPDGTIRSEFWIGQRYTNQSISGGSTTGTWRSVTVFNLPVVGSNGCKLNEWYHFEGTTTIPEQAADGINTQSAIQFYNSNADVSASVTFRIKNVKLEYGNKATDWSPAPEDVEDSINTKLEDYATLEVTNNKISTAVTETKTYADGKASNAVSTAKSYTDQTAASITSTVEGIDGRMTQMEQNADGFTWTIDETAIVSSVNEYYKSDSATSLVGGSWSESQPPWEEGKYIWMRTKNTNGKGVPSYTTPACITGNTGAQGPQGEQGEKGDTGATGKGVSSTSVTYQAGSSGTSAPTGTWSSSVPSTSASAPYMWTKTVITYTDNSTSTSYSVGSTPEGIDIGGRNLYLGTKDFSGDWSDKRHWDVSSETYKGFTVIQRQSSWMGLYQPVEGAFGEVYTFSGYVKKTGGITRVFTNGFGGTTTNNGAIIGTKLNEWEHFSVTTTVSTSGSLGFRVENNSSAETTYVCGLKLEKGNKATDWTPAPEDVDDATAEAAKVATNYMKFENNGLTVGNMTASTLGRNVLIDSDSVDIRNGSEVLASYGEEIVLRHDGKDAFTIKDSEFISTAISEGRYFEATSESVTTSSGEITSVVGTISKTLSFGISYIWHVKKVDQYMVFQIPSNYGSLFDITSITITDIKWSSSKPATTMIHVTGISATAIEVPCAYCDGNAVINTIVKGSLWIENSGDVNGFVENIPPLAIGVNGGNHLEIDGNEIAAKSDDVTPSHLYLNMDGGNVSFNNNETRSLLIREGFLYGKNESMADSNNHGLTDEYIEVLNCFDDHGHIRIGSGTNATGGNMYLYGASIRTNSDIVVPNGSGFQGKNTSGVIRNNFQPCNTSNNCLVGYGSYSASEGATHIYGNKISLYTKTYVNSTRPLKVLWSGSYYMNASQTASLSEAVLKQLNGIVLVWSKYSGGAQNYEWNCFFIPKQMVSAHSGAGYALLCRGTYPSYKYIYVNNTSIGGNAINENSSAGTMGTTLDNKNHVLRYVYGV